MLSFGKVFRLNFIVFFLYLLQDVFFRWDGVRYYAPFSEFMPSVALISILWSIVTVMVSIFIWLIIMACEWLCQRLRWKINAETLLILSFFSLLFGITAWIDKEFISGIGLTAIQLKLLVSAVAIIATIFSTWVFRGKSGIILERITPLVWLFGIIVILSVPIVIYQTWIKGEAKIRLRDSTQLSGIIKKRPNIILVTFDALRASDMSIYGYQKPTTPFISKWAKEAAVFTKAEAESTWTFPTTCSLMTGKRQWTQQYDKSNRTTDENLARVLKNNGYYNMAFIQNIVASVNNLGISTDFDIAPPSYTFDSASSVLDRIDNLLYRHFGDKILLYNWITKWDFLFYRFLIRFSQDADVTKFPPKLVFNSFLSELSFNRPPEPYFAWIHLNPPHDPYLPEDPYMGMFNSSSDLRTQKEQFKFTRNEKSPYVKVEQETLNILRARYDEFIRYCDKQFEYFIGQLENKGMLHNTAIILSSDHGESFEHGYLSHGNNNLYEQITHIPLIVKEPGQTKGLIIQDPVEQIDVSASILDLANIRVPAWMEGRSLLPFMHGEKLLARPVFSMEVSMSPPWSKVEATKGRISVRDGDVKLIYNPVTQESFLFNLNQDPEELTNLFIKETEIAQRLLFLIQDSLRKAYEKRRKE